MKYDPITGSSCLSLPKEVKAKEGCLTIQNNDAKFFSVVHPGNLKGSSTNLYACRAMLDVLLAYDQEVKNSHLTLGLYSKVTAAKMNLTTVNGANSVLKARTQYIRESKLIEVSGLLYCNLWFILLQCRLPSFERRPLKDSTSPAERQFCIDG